MSAMRVSDIDLDQPPERPSDQSILSMRAIIIGAILLLQIAAIYCSPDDIQKTSGTDVQHSMQFMFSTDEQMQHGNYKPWTNINGIIPGTSPAITDKALNGILDLISLFTTGSTNRASSTADETTWPLGMQMAITLYRVTTWKTWFLASALVAWSCDHDFGSQLFVFTTATHIAQSLVRNIVGSPPSYWLSATSSQQLCHCEGYSLPPENLTLCVAFFLFINYFLHKEQKAAKHAALSPEEQDLLRSNKWRMTLIRSISIAIPSLLFFLTTYYGTYSLIDNFFGITFALFAFSIYRIWENYNETHQGEEADSISNKEQSIITYGKTFIMPAIMLGMVYGIEKLSRTWDVQALNEYPDMWKTNVEYNCNVKEGAAAIIMSIRTFGFGFANYANTASLFGVIAGVFLRDAAHIADTSNRHNIWKTILRLGLGLSISGLFSHVLRWYFLEEPNPYRSYVEKYSTVHSNAEVEQVEAVILHLDLAFKPIWILVLSPLFFDYLGLGSYLLDDSEFGEEPTATEFEFNTVKETTERVNTTPETIPEKRAIEKRTAVVSRNVVVRETIRVRHDMRR